MTAFLDFEAIDQYGPQQFKEKLELTAAELLRDDVEQMGEVLIEGEARAGDLPLEYRVEGKVRFAADLDCSRCVDPFPFATETLFTVRYRPYPAATEEDQEVEISETELDVEYYAEPRASLRELAIEQIQLSIPMKLLCTDKCLGLCVTCGANLNQGGCSCGEKVTDERWAGLAGIREELRKKTNI